MKNITGSTKDNAENAGYTHVELQARVRLRAYEIYQERDRVDGYALDDWAQAEAEILQPERSAAALKGVDHQDVRNGPCRISSPTPDVLCVFHRAGCQPGVALHKG
jgi:hypothetical protein